MYSVDGYTWFLKIYAGKAGSGVREIGLARNICLQLASKLLDQGRTFYIDNFSTSYELAKAFLERKTHVVETFRSNKKHIPKEVTRTKLKRGDMLSREDQNGVVVLAWKNTRDVRLLSTKHPPIMGPVNRQKKSNLEPSSCTTQIDSTSGLKVLALTKPLLLLI